jgi:hypothetical protein
MYKYEDCQTSFSDFGQPYGMRMDPNNRWVKKASSIPWPEIERRYAQLFAGSKTGNVAKPLRLALGACLIQAEYGFSDAETALMIQEHPYLQYFCGFSEYREERPFDPSSMVHFRKRLTHEVMAEINELIISHNTPAKKSRGGSRDNGGAGPPPSNKGTLILDSTCAPSQIRYPQDTSLLNEAREKAEALVDALCRPGEKKPRTYRRNAHREYVKFSKTRKKGAKTIRKQIKRQLGYLSRDLGYVARLQSQGRPLSAAQSRQLETVRAVYAQQKHMFDNRVHSVENRIVSIGQPWLRPIVRGKAAAPVEFGIKLDISVANGWTRLETAGFDAYNESVNLIGDIERFKERTGFYPERVLADKIYRNRENLKYCKEKKIRLSGPPLGRPKKNADADRKQTYIDERDRIEVERRFSLAKRKCGLGLITAKLEDTIKHCVAISVVLLNLKKVRRLFCAKLRHWHYNQRYVMITNLWTVVQ